jgi:hypothetical protein
VRVIPVEPGVAHDEVIRERLALLHFRLRDLRHAVHLDRHAHAVPVHRRRLIELVGEMDDEPIADARLDERTRNAAVVGPGVDDLAGRDLDVGELRDQVDLDDRRIGIAIGRFGELDAVGPARGRLRRGADRKQQAEHGCGKADHHGNSGVVFIVPDSRGWRSRP